VILLKAPCEPKYVFLLEEDVALLRSLPRGFPQQYIFRHVKGNGAAKPGQQFGKDYLYGRWMDACRNLGIQGVPLYPGTRHSSEVALRQDGRTPEEIWRAAGTRSNKARERYLLVEGDELRSLYRQARTDTGLIRLPVSKSDKKIQ
jgi:hypothetical protein